MNIKDLDPKSYKVVGYEPMASQDSAPAPRTPSLLPNRKETFEDVKQTGKSIYGTLQGATKKVDAAFSASAAGKQSWLRGFGQAAGATAGAASGVAGNIVTGAAKTILPQGVETGLKRGVEAVATPVVQSNPAQFLVERYNALDEKSKRDVDALLGVASFATDLIGSRAASKPVMGVARQGAKAAERTAESAIKATDKLIDKGRGVAQKALPPPPTPIQAVRQVLQGETRDIQAGVKALSSLNTKGVKTNADLLSRINETIPKLAQKVDTELAKDAKRYSLEELKVGGKTKAGESVKVGYVDRALTHLEELYTSTGDTINQKNIQDLIQTAQTQGLTRLEVNNIARLYGEEFSTKAFGKLGEPLTSVNAQKFENTRLGLKAKVREGLGGKEAKQADEVMSSLFRTRKLVERNVEAVNKLQQKIQERGLLEKFGYQLSKYTDILTGGTLRGLVGGLLPRGVGNKVMNAIDLEKLLSRNLEVIQKAVESGSDAEILKVLKRLD